MKKTVFTCLFMLIAGLVIGFLIGDGLPSLMEAPTSVPATPPIQITAMNLSPAPTPTLDRTDNVHLLDRAGLVLKHLKVGDYAALSTLAHPDKGIAFTPYSTVSTEYNLELSAKQIAGLAEDKTAYVWGVEDGKGEPIRMTGVDYFARFVFNADYTQAPNIGLDTVLATGNAMENAAEAYPDARFVEYHFPGLDPKKEGYDWCSLKLVFEEYQSDWFLVGLIHSEWTI